MRPREPVHAFGATSHSECGGWRWSKSEASWAPPGALDSALTSASDGYATGLVVYALKVAGGTAARSAFKRGEAWLIQNQREVQVGDIAPSAWRAHSLNFDREHGGPRGEPLRRLFMSDLATAFAVLALTEPGPR